MTAETQPTRPRLNQPAPDFPAKTAMGPRKLADYKSRWLVLFAHLADFTPVCSTGFMAFVRNHARVLELTGTSARPTCKSPPAPTALPATQHRTARHRAAKR